MELQTSLFGTITVEDSETVTFKNGLPGFLNEHRFVIVPVQDTPFVVLQSVTDTCHFFMINPFEFFLDYEFDLPDEDVDKLELESEDDVRVWSIVVLKEDLAQSTVNLQAPVVVNAKNKRAKQVVLRKYQIRHPLFSKTKEKLTK